MSASVEKLEAARALIARPGGWTQNVLCQWENGRATCDYCEVDLQGSCYCAEDALVASGAARVTHGTTEILMFRDFVGGNIPYWNDAPDRTQADVIAAFDCVIELARSAS